MPKRSGKQDVNVKAFSIVQKLTGEESPDKPSREKNPAAVTLGRLGGLKGGRARARKLTATQRKESARRAAQERWSKKR